MASIPDLLGFLLCGKMQSGRQGLQSSEINVVLTEDTGATVTRAGPRRDGHHLPVGARGDELGQGAQQGEKVGEERGGGALREGSRAESRTKKTAILLQEWML